MASHADVVMQKTSSQPNLNPSPQPLGTQTESKGTEEFMQILNKILSKELIQQYTKEDDLDQNLNNLPKNPDKEEIGTRLAQLGGRNGSQGSTPQLVTLKTAFTNKFMPKKASLREWLGQASLQDKKGLRVINAVVKHRGTKRFRTLKFDMDSTDKKLTRKASIDTLFAKIKSNDKESFLKAKHEFIKAQFKSNYGSFFGRKPDLTDYKDMNILKFKKFSELKCTEVLNRVTVNYLDCWQKTKEHPDYLGMALYTIKSIYTYFSQFKPLSTIQRLQHAKPVDSDKIQTQRLDKMMDKIYKSFKKPKERSLKTSCQTQRVSPAPSFSLTQGNFFISPNKSKAHLKTNSIFSSKSALEGFGISNYQANFQGLASTGQVHSVKNYYSTSCATGAMVPDPKLVDKQQIKARIFEKQNIRVAEKLQNKYAQMLATPRVQSHRPETVFSMGRRSSV